MIPVAGRMYIERIWLVLVIFVVTLESIRVTIQMIRIVSYVWNSPRFLVNHHPDESTKGSICSYHNRCGNCQNPVNESVIPSHFPPRIYPIPSKD